MPSKALSHWSAHRLQRILQLDTQCSAIQTNPSAIALRDENLRAFAMLLSAHFQGFLRDLYSECALAVMDGLPVVFKLLLQSQFNASRKLDTGNPKYETIRDDFERFGLDLTSKLATDVAHPTRVTRINHLNAARNFAAHDKNLLPPGVSLDLVSVRAWKTSCDDFVSELDRVMGDHLRTLLGKSPW